MAPDVLSKSSSSKRSRKVEKLKPPRQILIELHLGTDYVDDIAGFQEKRPRMGYYNNNDYTSDTPVRGRIMMDPEPQSLKMPSMGVGKAFGEKEKGNTSVVLFLLFSFCCSLSVVLFSFFFLSSSDCPFISYY